MAFAHSHCFSCPHRPSPELSHLPKLTLCPHETPPSPPPAPGSTVDSPSLWVWLPYGPPVSGIAQHLSLCDSLISLSVMSSGFKISVFRQILKGSLPLSQRFLKLGPGLRGVRGQTALPSAWALGADGFGLLPLQMSASKRARKASSDLDQASISPSEEENSESSSESEKTSDQVSRWLAPRVGAERRAARGPCSLPSLHQDFTPEKKAVVRAPRRGPLAGRKKKVEVFVFCSPCPPGRHS